MSQKIENTSLCNPLLYSLDDADEQNLIAKIDNRRLSYGAIFFIETKRTNFVSVVSMYGRSNNLRYVCHFSYKKKYISIIKGRWDMAFLKGTFHITISIYDYRK